MNAERRGVRAAVVGAVSLLVFAGASAFGAEEVRTDPGDVGGFRTASTAAPVAVQLFEPTIPVPTDPGQPQGEFALSHTATRLTAGPTARALASSVWPGPALGDGFNTVCQGCGQQWPAKADARYPEEPHDAEVVLPTGGGMRASARGLDVVAEADTIVSPADALVRVGSVRSRAASTVVDGVTVAEAVSSVGDAVLLDGVIRIADVTTTLRASSDTEAGTTAGTTTVAGLVVAGQGFVVDHTGVHPVRDGERQDGVGNPGVTSPEQLRDELGISVEPLALTEQVEGPTARRASSGLRITVDTGPLRRRLDALPLGDVVEQVPSDELKAQLYGILALAPRIVFTVGRGEVLATATPPLAIDLSFPAPPPPGPVAPPPDVGGVLAPAPFGPQADTALAPQVATAPPPEGGSPPLAAGAAAGPVELFGGLAPAVVVLSLVAAAVAARGLVALTASALGTGGAGCPAAGRLHDLRTEE